MQFPFHPADNLFDFRQGVAVRERDTGLDVDKGNRVVLDYKVPGYFFQGTVAALTIRLDLADLQQGDVAFAQKVIRAQVVFDVYPALL